MEKEYNIAVIGLGYVGLPLSVLFAQKYAVIGYDINETRIKELRQSVDVTNEVSEVDLKKVLLPENHLPNKGTGLYFSSSQDELRQANYYIITVPTPVDKNNSPDLTPLKKASRSEEH